MTFLLPSPALQDGGDLCRHQTPSGIAKPRAQPQRQPCDFTASVNCVQSAKFSPGSRAQAWHGTSKHVLGGAILEH